MAALDVGELVQQREAAEAAALAAAARSSQLQQELAQVHTASSFPWVHSVWSQWCPVRSLGLGPHVFC